MSKKFYKIRIGGVWLTENGAQNALACKLSVAGADALLIYAPVNSATVLAVDGTPINIFVGTSAGRILEIRVLVLAKDVWNLLVAEINTALENGSTINLTGTGDIGDFDVDCLPLLPKPFEAAEFKNERIKNSIFRFITT